MPAGDYNEAVLTPRHFTVGMDAAGKVNASLGFVGDVEVRSGRMSHTISPEIELNDSEQAALQQIANRLLDEVVQAEGLAGLKPPAPAEPPPAAENGG